MAQRVLRWTKAWRAAQRRLPAGAAVVVVLLISQGPEAASAQTGQVQVSYDVEFFTTGVEMSRLGNCTGGLGSDKLSGTITGWEPAPMHEDITYQGKLIRDTDITFCYTATDPNRSDEAYECTVNIRGKALVPVEFDLYADGRGGYLRAQDTSVKVYTSKVSSNCDPVEMAQWEDDYYTGSTAGSPDGQPINIVAFPLSGPYPRTFPPGLPGRRPTPVGRSPSGMPISGPPGPSTGDLGIWTLKVLGRRP